MTGLSHASTGVLIALAIPHPVAIPIAVASHFALDRFPHWGDDNLSGEHSLFRRIILLDAVFGVGVVILMMALIPHHRLLIALCGAAACVPDLMWLPNFIRETRKKATKPHNKLMMWHSSLQFERSWGIATEAVWLLAVLVLLARFVSHLS